MSTCLFNFYAEYIIRNAGLEEAQAAIKIAGRNINNLRYTEDGSRRLECLERYIAGEAKFGMGLDHGIQSHHFMGNRWRNSGNSVRLYFLGAPKSLQMVSVAMKLKDAYSLEEKL